MANKCRICHVNEREWMFQPWGPGEEASFTFPGHHYRGFDVVPVCDACKQRIEAGEIVKFRHKNRAYEVNGQRLGYMQRVEWVRREGTLAPGGTHLFVAYDADPDWDVMLCGEVINREDWQVLGVNSVTVGDICLTCLQDFIRGREHDAKDRKTHSPYLA